VSRLLAGRRSGRRGSRGQGLVEFALIVPVFLLILLAMAEFGFVFSHHLTITYATREGARVGAALADGTADFPCSPNNPVDTQVVAAVQRVLTSPGSQIDIGQVSEIRIYKANASGGESGPVDRWQKGSGPTVDGVQLKFANTSNGWDACGRNNGASPDSLGVSIVYTYNYRTPLASVLRFFGGAGAASLAMTDKTVMQLNPTQ
jgi:hypothetical protein